MGFFVLKKGYMKSDRQAPWGDNPGKPQQPLQCLHDLLPCSSPYPWLEWRLVNFATAEMSDKITKKQKDCSKMYPNPKLSAVRWRNYPWNDTDAVFRLDGWTLSPLISQQVPKDGQNVVRWPFWFLPCDYPLASRPSEGHLSYHWHNLQKTPSYHSQLYRNGNLKNLQKMLHNIIHYHKHSAPGSPCIPVSSL